MSNPLLLIIFLDKRYILYNAMPTVVDYIPLYSLRP